MTRTTRKQKASSLTDPTTAYARAVTDGNIVAGPHVRAACARHLADLENCHARGLVWDVPSVDRIHDFFREVLVLSDGEFDGTPFALQPSQSFIVGSLMGWKAGDGSRRFRSAYIEMGKGNGKALALDTRIPTPIGWTTMGEIKIGDALFDDAGNVCRVIAATEVMRDRPCYRMKFSDGAEVIADENHMWVILPDSGNGSSKIVTTREIFQGILKLDASSDRQYVLVNGVYVVACDPTPSVPVRCIEVDSPSNQFLITDNFIPTHNSPLCAGIGLYMMLADGEAGAECYAAAVTRDQANIMFRDAVRMVDASRILSSRVMKSGSQTVYNLAHPASSSFFRPVSSEGRGLDGKRVHYAAIDEVHEHPTAVVVNKMRAGTKGRRQALILEITNSGYDRQTVCWDHHEYSIAVAHGVKEDDSWFSYVCALDEDDDPFEDPSCWIKVNPLLDIAVTHRYLEEQVREAKGMPSKESIVRRLNFCQWVDAANPWIGQDLWRACEDDFDNSLLLGRRCFGGLDLSGAKDMTALVLAFPFDDHTRLLPFFWTPGETLLERERTDKAPYSIWVKDGHLFTTPGRAVDYTFVANTLGDLTAKYDIESIAFDPYRIKYFEQDMFAMGVGGVTLIPHGQGYYKSQESDLWMPRSVDLLEQKISKGILKVRKNPVLTWNSASAVLEADAKENRIFTKRKSTGRIDGIVASAMAVGNSEREGVSERSFWENEENWR